VVVLVAPISRSAEWLISIVFFCRQEDSLVRGGLVVRRGRVSAVPGGQRRRFRNGAGPPVRRRRRRRRKRRRHAGGRHRRRPLLAAGAALLQLAGRPVLLAGRRGARLVGRRRPPPLGRRGDEDFPHLAKVARRLVSKIKLTTTQQKKTRPPVSRPCLVMSSVVSIYFSWSFTQI